MKTGNKKSKVRIFHPKRCRFKINLNNLAPKETLSAIFDKLDDEVIERLNEILSEIKFYVGGNQRHYDQIGLIDAGAFEFDCKKRTIYFFMFKIFQTGFQRWNNLPHGALKRFIYESFIHEILKAITELLRIDLTVLEEASQVDLNAFGSERFEILDKLFSYHENSEFRFNYISIGQYFWMSPIPNNQGFLTVLYNRRLKMLKSDLNKTNLNYAQRIKIFNELRKLKLDYRYEYNLSELVNYCIMHKEFRAFFRANNQSMFSSLKRELYYKAKRRILKFFKTYQIMDELKEYKDTAGRTHLFMTHATFERVKSACLQTCLANIKNKKVEIYDNFKNFYRVCPICKKEDVNVDVCENIFFSNKLTKNNYFKKILLEKMEQGCSFDELNDEVNYFGIPCPDCFQITNNIMGKYSEFDQVQRFIKEFAKCPICHGNNEPNYLIRFYHDDSRKDLRDSLIEYMLFGDENAEKYNLVLGIPCCACFRNVFGKDPFEIDLDYIINEI